VIRCYQPDDAALLQKAIDESIEHLIPWMPWAKQEPETVSQKAERLQTFREEFENGIDFAFGIFSRDEEVLIGSTGLHTRIGPNEREIGYWIHADHVRKGYAVEAVSALCKVGFEVEGHERIEIHCSIHNIESQGIPRKLGFQHVLTDKTPQYEEGEMIWALTKEAYTESNMVSTKLEAFDAKGVPLKIR